MPNYKVVDADELDAKLSAIGDSVRAKTGKTELIPIDDIPAEIDGISGGGGDDRVTKWIEGTLTELYDPNATSVCDNFASGGSSSYQTKMAETLTAIDLPNVTKIGRAAFGYCAQLKNINIPNVISIGESAFAGCSNLQENLYFPNLTVFTARSSNNGAQFYACKSIKSFIAPLLEKVNPGSFRECSALETVKLPFLKTIASTNASYTGVFVNCTSLKRADFRNATTVAYKDFSGCSSLKILDITSTVTTSKMSLPIASNNTAFRVISMRTDIEKNLSSVPTTGVFAEGGVGGYMLVKSSLIESYQTATNWSALVAAGTCTFLPLEEYTVDGTLEGELDWDKVEALIPEDESGGTEE